jgi:hypothetical protein
MRGGADRRGGETEAAHHTRRHGHAHGDDPAHARHSVHHFPFPCLSLFEAAVEWCRGSMVSMKSLWHTPRLSTAAQCHISGELDPMPVRRAAAAFCPAQIDTTTVWGALPAFAPLHVRSEDGPLDVRGR